MSIISKLKIENPYDLDSPEATIFHRDTILQKKFLKKLYIEWYNSYFKEIKDLPQGHHIEIGAGGSFIKELKPEIITSDILPLPHCDMTFMAEKMPFENNSVSSVFMMDVLHHIPNCRDFFKEAQRVLCPGGVIFMIEPATTFFSKFIYKNLHHEPFNEKVDEWHFPTKGPLSDANGALPNIIFKRDINKFNNLYPQLKLQKIKYHTPLRYLITGGLSYKSIVPGWSFFPISFFEKLFYPVYPLIAMFNTIVVKKAE